MGMRVRDGAKTMKWSEIKRDLGEANAALIYFGIDGMGRLGISDNIADDDEAN